MVDCSCTKFLREAFEGFHVRILCYRMQRNVGFRGILGDYCPLRVGVKAGNSVLVSIIVLAVLQEYYHMIRSSARHQEEKIVLPSPYAMGCIWIIFVLSNVLIT